MKTLFLSLLILAFSLTSGYCGVDFDGTDDEIDCGNNSSLDMMAEATGDFTVCALIELSSVAADGAIISAWGDVGNEQYLLKFETDNDHIKWATHTTSGYFVADSPDNGILVNTPYYVCGRRKTHKLSVFVDGVKSSDEPTQAGTTDTFLGLDIGENLRDDEPFAGIITEVSEWSEGLSDAEIILLANSKVKGIPLQIKVSDLVLYLPLDDLPDSTSGDGATFRDLSGTGNDGTGDDGTNDSGLTAVAETVLSYPSGVIGGL